MKHGVKALIYFKQPVRANAQVAEEDGDDLEDDEGDASGTGDDAADAAAKAAEAAKRTARFTVQKPAKAEAAKAAKAAKAAAGAQGGSAASRSQERGAKEKPVAREHVEKNALSARSGEQAQPVQPAQQQQRDQDSRKRKAGGKAPPATPALEDKASSSAPPSTPAGGGASPTSPPAKSARSSEAGSDADGVDDADVAISPQDFPSLADAAAVPARRRGSEWQEVTRGGKGKGKEGSPPALAPTPAAQLRLQAEIGRRAVNISKEIFEAAGVPVPPGYVKVGAGDLRRVFKEIAR